MVAEGSPVVMSLIESGKVDAVVGVSCLSVLERVFPYMEAGAVPGIAIPLLNEGCSLTTVDLDWVWDAIHLLGSDPTRALDLESLRREVDAWFASGPLEAVLGPPRSETEAIAREWLSKAGKRWRPFLAVCTYQALQVDPGAHPPDDLKTLAIAIECFHKASLVHDDIEDGDDARYGEKTLHEEQGVPVALNVGDFLIGEGYRLLAAAPYPAETRVAMLAAVSEGHRALCVGQGAELLWRRAPRPLTAAEVLEMFRLKTAPAFDVALQVGALAAGAGEELWGPLRRYSASVGTAYQIRDDLEDFDGDAGDLARSRPPLILAIGHDRATGAAKAILGDVWRGSRSDPHTRQDVARILREVEAFEVTRELLDVHKFEAMRILGEVGSFHLKGLLRRVISKIFGELEAMGCCDEYRAGDASGGGRGAETAA
jgi:geranylgeranyl diphosphate synthase, type II